MSGVLPPEERAALLEEYKNAKMQGVDNQMDRNQFNQTDDRSSLENAGRGVMSGLAKSGYSTLQTVGKLISKLGGQNVGDPIQKYAHDGAQEAQEFYDPHGMAGRLGEGGAQLVGNTAQFMAGGEVLGGEKLAARGAAAFPRLLGGAPGAAALRALPGATADASIQGLTARDNSDDPGFFKTLRNDELGAAAVGGGLGAVRGLGRLAGKVGSKLMGGGGEEVGEAIGKMPPAPPSAPAMAPDPVAPVDPNLNGGVGDPMLAGSAPMSPKVGQVGATQPDFEAQVKAAMATQEAPATPTQEAATPSTMSEQAPAAQPAAPKATPKPPKKAPVKTEAPKATDTQADAEVSKPAVAAKKGSQKGGKAQATPTESNSGTGAQGAPKASKPAPATKPAASNSPAATPAPATLDDARAKLDSQLSGAKKAQKGSEIPAPTKVTRKNAVAEKKGRIAPVAAKGGLTPQESTTESDNESYIKMARGMAAGLTEGSPAHKAILKKIAEAEAENAAFAARRKGP